MSPNTPLAPIDLKDKDGKLFARLLNLPDGGNAALFRSTNKNGEMCIKLLMRAYGVESSTDISYAPNPLAVDTLIKAIGQKEIEKAYDLLKKSLEQNAPQLVSIYRSVSFLSGFGVASEIPKDVAKVHSVDGQDFLVLRMEHKASNKNLLDPGVSCLLVVGPSVEQVFNFASSQQRETAYSNPSQLDDIVGQVHTRQMGASVGSSATARIKPRHP